MKGRRPTTARADAVPGFGLPLADLPRLEPPAGSPCPGELTLADFVANTNGHPQREQIREHLLNCTECSTAADELLTLHAHASTEIGLRGALDYLREEHPARHRYEAHLEHSLTARTLVGLLRPFFLPAVRSPALGWATSAVMTVALIAVTTRQPNKPTVVPKGNDVRIDRTTHLDAANVATYLAEFARDDLAPEQIEQLKRLTNQLESRLLGNEKLEADPAYLLTLAGLFQRRYELTGEQRAWEAREELQTRASGLLGNPR